MTIIKIHGPSVDEYLQGTRQIEFVSGIRPVDRTLQIEFAGVKAFTFSSSYSTQVQHGRGTAWIIMDIFPSEVNDSIKWEFSLCADKPENPYPVITFEGAEVTEALHA